MKKRSLVGFLALFVVGGLLLSCLLIYLFEAGLFVRWERVAQIPDPTARLVDVDLWTAYFQTEDDQIFSCSTKSYGECWIPDVPNRYQDREILPCSEKRIAFLPFARSPRNITSCIYAKGAYMEGRYETVFALDADGYFWGWEVDHSSYSVLLYPFAVIAGGLLGVLIGTFIWTVGTFADRKRLPAGTALFSKGQIVLLVLPWLLVGGIFVFWYAGVYIPSNTPNPKIDPMVTFVAQTVTAEMAELEKEQQVEMTPAPGLVRFRFMEDFCGAKWSGSSGTAWCFESNPTSSVFVSKATDPVIGGVPQPGEGLWFHIRGIYQREIEGEFPGMQIQEGDHLKVTLGCLDESAHCGGVFEITLNTQGRRTMTLGRWMLTKENPLKEIDLDLSKYAGQSARFNLRTYYEDDSEQPIDLVWIEPRIEQE